MNWSRSVKDSGSQPGGSGPAWGLQINFEGVHFQGVKRHLDTEHLEHSKKDEAFFQKGLITKNDFTSCLMTSLPSLGLWGGGCPCKKWLGTLLKELVKANCGYLAHCSFQCRFPSVR